MNAVINMNIYEIIDYFITDAHVDDAKNRISIIKMLKNSIIRLFGDKYYNSKAIYNELDDEAAIPPMSNASPLSTLLIIVLKLQDSPIDSIRNYGRLRIIMD